VTKYSWGAPERSDKVLLGCRPESSGFNDFLDTGLRRHDEYKVKPDSSESFIIFKNEYNSEGMEPV
jgi:hypothetical protein